MQTSPEIRFRIDRREREQFEQLAQRLGMDMNEMVRVFIRRSIAAGGFPFEMRAPAEVSPPAAQLLPIADIAEHVSPSLGVSVAYLSELAGRAFAAAHQEHVKAGRLPARSPWDEPDIGSSRAGEDG